MMLITGNGIEVIHGLVESAKLVADHPPTSLLGQSPQLVVCPVAHAACYLEGSLVVAHRILVEQTLKNLMQGVERCPY